MDFAREEDVKAIVNDLDNSELNQELLKVTCFNANVTVMNKLFEKGVEKPKIIPDDLRVAACYYAVADMVQSFTQPDEYRYRDYIVKADKLIQNYITRSKTVSPYTSSQSPLPKI